MWIDLTVGVAPGLSLSLRAALESLGVDLQDPGPDPDPKKLAVIVTEEKGYEAYAASGGTLLAPYHCWPSGCTEERPLQTPFSRQTLATADERLSPAYGSFETVAIRVGRVGKGWCVELPGEVGPETWDDTRVGLNLFFCGYKKESFASEITTIKSKANAQKIILLAVQHAFHLRGLPLAVKTLFPNNASNVFCFRLDCDGGNEKDVVKTLDTLGDDVVNTAFFFNVHKYADKPWLPKKICERGGLVDNHDFVHHVFKNKNLEIKNITLAHQWITQQTQREPLGFVCPGFGYNKGTIKHLIQCGYRYFNSFGRDYDMAPHRIYAENQNTSIWNISYHPVCLGRLLKGMGGYDRDAFISYYHGLIEKRQRRGEPHFYYCHPERRIGRYPEFYEDIRGIINSLGGVEHMNQERYAAFLERRSRTKADLAFNPADQSLKAGNQHGLAQAGVGLGMYGNGFAPIDDANDGKTTEADFAPYNMAMEVGDALARGTRLATMQGKPAVDAASHETRDILTLNHPRLMRLSTHSAGRALSLVKKIVNLF